MTGLNIVSLATAYPITYKQSTWEEGSTATQTCSFDSDVSAGDLLIVCADVAGQTITGVSDSLGSSYTAISGTPVQQDSGTPRWTAMYWAVAPSSGANTATVSFDVASSSQSVIVISAYTPSGGVVSVDASGANSGSSITSLTVVTNSSKYPIDLLVMFCASFGSNSTPAGYMRRASSDPDAATLCDSTANSDGIQTITETFASSAAGLILAAFSAVRDGGKLNFTSCC